MTSRLSPSCTCLSLLQSKKVPCPGCSMHFTALMSTDRKFLQSLKENRPMLLIPEGITSRLIPVLSKHLSSRVSRPSLSLTDYSSSRFANADSLTVSVVGGRVYVFVALPSSTTVVPLSILVSLITVARNWPRHSRSPFRGIWVLAFWNSSLPYCTRVSTVSNLNAILV